MGRCELWGRLPIPLWKNQARGSELARGEASNPFYPIRSPLWIVRTGPCASIINNFTRERARLFVRISAKRRGSALYLFGRALRTAQPSDQLQSGLLPMGPEPIGNCFLNGEGKVPRKGANPMSPWSGYSEGEGLPRYL